MPGYLKHCVISCKLKQERPPAPVRFPGPVAETDLDTLVAFRHEAYGGSKAEIAGWLQNIVGIDNVFLVEQEGAQGGLVSMVCAVPVELHGRRGVWLCGMATAPQFRGRGLMTRLLDGCLRAFSASGFEFAVAVPETARAAARLRGLQFADAFALRILRPAPSLTP